MARRPRKEACRRSGCLPKNRIFPHAWVAYQYSHSRTCEQTTTRKQRAQPNETNNGTRRPFGSFPSQCRLWDREILWQPHELWIHGNRNQNSRLKLGAGPWRQILVIGHGQMFEQLLAGAIKALLFLLGYEMSALRTTLGIDKSQD